jgi:hypothetical protein
MGGRLFPQRPRRPSVPGFETFKCPHGGPKPQPPPLQSTRTRERAEDGSMQGQTCVICSALFQEFGHNAEPVKRGRCCNLCNDAVVIPERIRLMRLQDETVHKIQRDREPS